MSEKVILEMKDIVKDYSGFKAVDHVDFSLHKGEIVAIIGPSGSGKSTLLRCINGLNTITSGEIDLEGETGMVFQHFNLFPHMTCLENITYAPIKVKKIPKEQAVARAKELLKMVGLESKADVYPAHISGGQKQRVAIAGVMAMKPECIVLDEPTAMLDPNGRKEVIRTVHELNRVEGITMVLITHYMEEVVDADRVIVMDDGHIVMDGTPKEIFSRVEELKQYRMDVPQVTELAWELKKKGIPLPDGILRKSELLDALVPLLKEE